MEASQSSPPGEVLRLLPRCLLSRSTRCFAGQQKQQPTDDFREEREVEPDWEAEDFPGSDTVRTWQALETETRQVITLAAGFFLLPALVSVSARIPAAAPVVFGLTAAFPGEGRGHRPTTRFSSVL